MSPWRWRGTSLSGRHASCLMASASPTWCTCGVVLVPSAAPAGSCEPVTPGASARSDGVPFDAGLDGALSRSGAPTFRQQGIPRHVTSAREPILTKEGK
jgi:hypothetical protein